jgi:hypothetical protein
MPSAVIRLIVAKGSEVRVATLFAGLRSGIESPVTVTPSGRTRELDLWHESIDHSLSVAIAFARASWTSLLETSLGRPLWPCDRLARDR